MKFRSNYEEYKEIGTINNQPSMVQSEHAEDLEINKIMDRYVKTGYMPLREVAPAFADLSVPMDFDSAQDKVLLAQKLFIELPLEIRDEFRTAQSLLQAFNSPLGQVKLQALGVLEKPLKNEPADPAAKRGQPEVPAVAPPEAKADKA